MNHNFDYKLKQKKHDIDAHLLKLYNNAKYMDTKNMDIRQQMMQICYGEIYLVNDAITYNQKRTIILEQKINKIACKIMKYVNNKSNTNKKIYHLNINLKNLKAHKLFINILEFKYIYKSDSKDTCCICYEDCINTTTISCPICNKSFHKVCIERWIILSPNKTCAHCVNNIWKKYKIDMDDEIALFNEQLLDNKNILVSNTFVNFKTKYDECITLYDNYKIMIELYTDKIMKFKQQYDDNVTIFNNYKKIIAMHNKTKMYLNIMKTGLTNMADMSLMPKIKHILKHMLANDAYNVFFMNQYARSNVLDVLSTTKRKYFNFYTMFNTRKELLGFIRKYEHVFVNYVTYVNRLNKRIIIIDDCLLTTINFSKSLRDYRRIKTYFARTKREKTETSYIFNMPLYKFLEVLSMKFTQSST